MKITPKLLSIPPFISTTWVNISSLHIKREKEEPILIISIQGGNQIEIPHLNQGDLDAIFEAHAKFSETEKHLTKDILENAFSFSLPIKSEGSMIDSLGSAMQHNPEQSDMPPLPPEVLEKITAIVRVFGLEDASVLGKPQPNCNCVYCQLTRGLQGEPEEEVAIEELQFRDWEIDQKDEKLYHVTNPLDKNEYYDVFLGDPIGCTCGQKNCEHIRAVLNT